MSTLIVAVLSFFGFILAYNTYGKFLANKVFNLDYEAIPPSQTKQDGVDYVPTNRFVLFGHHFTSIAGTGPIVGPALAIMWGWLPAILWVVFGSIFIGAVHDFAALVLSLRNRGQSIGDVSSKVLSPFARLLFLVLLAFILVIVVAVFGMVIATLFSLFPSSVFAVWFSMPVAILVGILSYKYKCPLLPLSVIAILLLYGAIWFGSYVLPPLVMPNLHPVYGTPVVLWILVLFVYCFCASVLPVWLLLQPRDYVNSQQLYLAMFLVVIGLFVSAFTGEADIIAAAPALRIEEAKSEFAAPPLFPFLFITVACGAVSGFHALVSSGTTSKQIRSKRDARFVGYGAMLLEGALAVVVIIACTAGIGMERAPELSTLYTTQPLLDAEGNPRPAVKEDFAGMGPRDYWNSIYRVKWSQINLGKQVGVFVEGGANFMERIGIPHKFAMSLMAVLIVSFAATTIDTAMRLLRYILQELGASFNFAHLKNKYVATGLGIAAALALALSKGPAVKDIEGNVIKEGTYGSGGLLFWEIFGSGNQLIAGLTLLIAAVYLYKRGSRGTIFLGIPAVFMFVFPIWAILLKLFDPDKTSGYIASGNYHLAFLGIAILFLAGWFLFESVKIISKLMSGNRE